MESESRELRETLKLIANAITPTDAMAGRDASGGRIESLTEAVMGITAGLFRVAEAIEYHADLVGEVKKGERE